MPIKWSERKDIDKICKQCKNKFTTKRNSVEYCSNSCGQKSRSKEKRNEAAKKSKKTWKRKAVKTNKTSILKLSSRTAQKIMDRMKLPCSNCGWDKTKCDIHHIYGKKTKDADEHKNLCYLCPNCHRLAHEGKLKPKDMINLKEYIGDTWKNYYYGKK